MEENQTETQSQEVQETTPEPQNPPSGVSFPTVGQPQKSGAGKTLLTLGILALVGVLGYFIYKSASGNKTPEVSPTPVETIAPLETVAPTATAKPADKSKVKIEIQNGTGITGEAAYLQTQLKNLGYTNITIGNATAQGVTATSVTFSKSLSADMVDEITRKLKDIYKEVDVKTSSTSSIDALIVTGLRKGATAKPSTTPSPKASTTATAASTSTSSPTASPTATPH